MDRLEVSVQAWRAKSVARAIVHHISLRHTAFGPDGSPTTLGNFYVLVTKAVGEGFHALKPDSPDDHRLITLARELTLEELKDWYHAGGKPREEAASLMAGVWYPSLRRELQGKVHQCHHDFKDAWYRAGSYGTFSSPSSLTSQARSSPLAGGRTRPTSAEEWKRRLFLLIAFICGSSLLILAASWAVVG